MSVSSPTYRSAVPPEKADRRQRRMWFAVVVVVLGLCAATIVLLAGQRQPRLSGTNAVFPSEPVVALRASEEFCQAAIVPEHTAALEVPLARPTRPGRLRLTVVDAAGGVVAHSLPDTRRVGQARFVLRRTIRSGLTGAVCIRNAGGEAAQFVGSVVQAGLTVNGRPVEGAVSVRYMRRGAEGTLSMVPVVAERIGRAREWLTGPARAVVIALLLLAGAALSTLLLLRRYRRAAVLCALVAIVNSAAWSLLTPVFQIPDETSHTSYVQDLAVKGSPPRPGDPPALSDEMTAVVGASNIGLINFNSFGRPVWDEGQDREWLGRLAARPDQRNPGSYANVVDYPPLYYLALVPVYDAAHAAGGSTLAAITPMRLVSALGAGATVLAIFGLLCEVLPGRRWLATSVALVCAYQPVLTWIAGGVNPDAALIPLGAAMFWLFARGFRTGLTTPLAIGLGLTMVAAALVQVRGLGFGPGWAVGLALVAWRGRRVHGLLRPLTIAALAAALPLVVYAVVNTAVWERPLIPAGIGAAASGTIAGPDTARDTGFATFLWQYFLPRVGSMTDFFHVPWTVKDLWVPMWVGKFGWYDYQFPNVVNRAALLLYAVVASAALIVLVRRLLRDPTARLRALVFALLTAGLVLAMARVAYPLRANGHTIFEQARYLMPLVGLYALTLALAATTLGRWARPVLAVLVAVSAVHLLFALELTVQRYYL